MTACAERVLPHALEALPWGKTGVVREQPGAVKQGRVRLEQGAAAGRKRRGSLGRVPAACRRAAQRARTAVVGGQVVLGVLAG